MVNRRNSKNKNNMKMRTIYNNLGLLNENDSHRRTPELRDVLLIYSFKKFFRGGRLFYRFCVIFSFKKFFDRLKFYGASPIDFVLFSYSIKIFWRWEDSFLVCVFVGF